jgi:hypothetical protein
MEAGVRALESGRDWLNPRIDSMRNDNTDDRWRDGDRASDRNRWQRGDRWPDDEVRSAGEAGVYGADARWPEGQRRHRGWEDDEYPRYRRDRHAGPYAPDEYAYSETGGRGRTERSGYDYDDHRTREFDARAMELQRERERRLHDIGPYARESGRSFGPNRRSYVPDDAYARADFGRGREFDHLPGSFGYGGEYRRDLSAVPGSFGYGNRHLAYGTGLESAGTYGQWSDGYVSHRGRGPKGYARSDERILEEVNERLSEDPLVDASDIEVRCDQGRVTLAGRVDARWIKHRAEDIADSVSGVKDIENRILIGGEKSRSAAETPAAERSGGKAAAARREGSGERAERDAPPQQPH